MKNSTLAILIIILSFISTLIYYIPYVSAIIFLVVFIMYLIFGLLDYKDGFLIPKKYNIVCYLSFVIDFIINMIVSFFTWLDSKPKIIKEPKKKWRAPEDWRDEI